MENVGFWNEFLRAKKAEQKIETAATLFADDSLSDFSRIKSVIQIGLNGSDGPSSKRTQRPIIRDTVVGCLLTVRI